MIRAVTISIVFLVVHCGAFAQSTTFGNPYPAQPSVIYYGGQAIQLPPPSVEQPRVTRFVEYAPVRQWGVSGGFIQNPSSRNVMANSRSQSRRINPISRRVVVRGYPGGRNISRSTGVYFRQSR